jgi:hypothetical protein
MVRSAIASARTQVNPESVVEKPLAVKIKRAAKLLGVCERSIRRYADDGLLESVHVGGLRLILYSSIERMLGLKDGAR